MPEQPPEPENESGTREIGRLRRRALSLMEQNFDRQTWHAFWRFVVQGDSASDIAADLGVSIWAVYKAKSRVLQRLRAELDGLMD